jgi:hypothetical protein
MSQVSSILGVRKNDSMKYLFAVLLFFFCDQAIGQQIQDKKLTYELKVMKFKKMKTTGVVMTVAGTVMTVVGISMINGSDQGTTTSNGQTVYNDDPKFATGAVLFVIGVPVAGAGIVLWSIGGSKARSYQRKLDGLTLNLKMTPMQSGLSFVYKFR